MEDTKEIFNEEVFDDNHGTAFVIGLEEEQLTDKEIFHRLVISVLPQYNGHGNSATILKFDGVNDDLLMQLGATFTNAGYRLRELLRDKDTE
jgi:hypothetical protein